MAPHRPDDDLPDVIDIRRGEIEFHLLDDIKTGLQPPDGGQKSLPSMIFYDEKGLRLFEDITYLDEYYPTNTEIEVLESYADQIALSIPHGAQVVELGSGCGSWHNLPPDDKLRARKSLTWITAIFARFRSSLMP